MAGAMRAELDWAPMHFDSWREYERASPLLPGETYEIITANPDEGYVLQYRPILGELSESRHYPIDQRPHVKVLGAIPGDAIPELRQITDNSRTHVLHRCLAAIISPARSQQEHPYGWAFGEQQDWYVNTPPARNPIEPIDEQVVTAYQVAGWWKLRLGPPVGQDSLGRLIFEPPGFNDGTSLDNLRLSVTAQPAVERSEAVIYRPDGTDAWRNVGTLTDQLFELHRRDEGRSATTRQAHIDAHSGRRPQR
jgi:hypothetical protein